MELNAPWADLIHEALVEILLKLDFEDLYLSIPFVCRSWRRASLDPACWEVADMEPCFLKRQETASWWLPAFEKRIDWMVTVAVDRSCGRLRQLRTRHCSDAPVRYLAARCPNVERLALISCPSVTDLSASEVAAACPKLQYLDLTECQQISSFSLQQFGQNCKALTVVKRSMMNHASDVNRARIIPKKILEALSSVNADEEALVLSRVSPQLKSVVMRYSELTDQGLEALVQGCPGLEYLDFYGSSNMTRRALDNAGEMLKSLKEFIRPRLPKSCHPRGARYDRWQLPDPAYRRFHLPYISILPLPRIVFGYAPSHTDRQRELMENVPLYSGSFTV